jgi:Ca-activated chloride channel family protein
MYPVKLPDLFKGSSINVMGRYKTGGQTTVTLTGKVNGVEKKFEYASAFTGSNNRHEFIPSLWAIRKVGFLLDQIRLNGEHKELVEEVTLLAKTYGIITPYTSYLIMEDEKVNIANRGMPGDRVIFNNRAMDDEGFLSQRSEEYKQLGANTDTVGVANSIDLQDLNTAKTLKKSKVGSGKMNYVDKTGKNRNFADQTRKVQNKMFYQNGEEWIDLDVQKNKDTKSKKIKFASDEYFKMLEDNPEVSKYYSVGKNVKFVFNNEMYEVTEK